jgi:hypothetical protein
VVTDAAFRERYGAWALVAGASEGLGAEFCHQLAARGLSIALVARRPEPLARLARELERAYGVETRPLAFDLARAEHLDELERATAELDVGLLVASAAASPIGEFLERSLAEHRAILDLNCRAMLVLSHVFAERLVDRGHGGMVLMSSLGSLQGTALTAHYSASKAYLRVLAEGLWEELRPRGVDVVACVAGPTDTPTFRAGHPQVGRWKLPWVQPASEVVAATLRGLGRTPVVTPGFGNSAIHCLLRLLPTSVAVRLVSRTTRKMYGR